MSSRRSDFRFHFANQIGVAMSDNDVRFLFGINEDSSNPDEGQEQIGVVMTHRTLKLLAHISSRLVSAYEEASGAEIPLPQEKIDLLEKAVTAGVKKRAAKKSTA